MKNIFISIGLQASGKSTYFKTHFSNNKSIIISYDNLGIELNTRNKDDFFSIILPEYYKRIEGAIKDNNIENIILDGTHMHKKSRAHSLEYKNQYKNIKVIALNFNTDIDTCISRNEKRDINTFIPLDSLYYMYSQYQKPELSEGFDKIINIDNIKDFSDSFLNSLKDYISTGKKEMLHLTINNHSFLKRINTIEQKSQYHQESLLQHLELITDEILKEHTNTRIRQLLLLLTIFHDVGKIITQKKKLDIFLKKGYKQIEGNLFINTLGEKVIVNNIDDYQFISHENVSYIFFEKEVVNQLISTNIITSLEGEMISFIIKEHLNYHKNITKSVDENINTLGLLFSKYDGLGRITLLNN